MKPTNSLRLFDYNTATTNASMIHVEEEFEEISNICWSPISIASSQSAQSPLSSPTSIMQPLDANFSEAINEFINGAFKEEEDKLAREDALKSCPIHPFFSFGAQLPVKTESRLQGSIFTPNTVSSMDNHSSALLRDQGYDSSVLMGSAWDFEMPVMSNQPFMIPIPVRQYSTELENAIEDETLCFQNDLKSCSMIETASFQTIIPHTSASRENDNSMPLIIDLTKMKQEFPVGHTSSQTERTSDAEAPKSSQDSSSSCSIQNDHKRTREAESLQENKKVKIGSTSPSHPSISGKSLPGTLPVCQEMLLPKSTASASNSSPPVEGDKIDRSHLYHSPMLVPGRRSKLPLRVVTHLRHFFLDNIRHPYPSDNQKQTLARETNLTVKQISDWFTNNRKRYYRTYEKYLTSAKCQLANKRKCVCECDGKHNPPIHNWRMMWE